MTNSTHIFLHAILFIAGFVAPPRFAYSQATDENFSLLDDFEKNKNSIKRDTFSLPEISNDGGQVVAYNSPEKNYKVFGLQLFGQPGKLHYLFVTDKNSNLKLVKQMEYEYHKAGEKGDYEVVKKITFYVFSPASLRVYNEDRALIKENDGDKREKIEKLFQQVKH